ncbi:peptidylprolyl isomerase [Thermus thermophilus]|uniref:peptidylprolyl isomerase n=1 Tax=Thermus thermophilus TaxID=274 RepID=A0AAD1KSZ9_THETH|nr:peptidylprolyl isomerase [Thermus thermophilus]BBL81241.1 peptidylprolyl isomerase [Thermus thermophilus]BBL83544.1 peptidylprolyl isomerase [Thermus thermophilus]BCZ85845.1 peptidylprolyl isomerase [Thermus thermophilus]BCZ88222.1 peptidylprolyl isomerase [Thermus thermophilus]BCZ90839.1 peptidylprolyl isomerase [Thermus thermophilus]
MFGLSKRAITILFGLLALAFALGAILLFTPQAGQQVQGKPVLWVNGKALYELDLLRLQGNDPLYAASPEGLLKTLVDTYFLEQVILTEALKQDAARVRVSSAEVRQEVNRIREQFGLKDKAAYEQFLNQVGYTDAQLRAEVKTQLQIQKRLEQIRSGAKPTEEEVRFYYEVFKENYRTEPRVKARQIVVDDKALAEELAAKAKAGEDFAALARQHSKVGAEQGGALGAGPGEAEPKPVTQVVFPTEVGEAVFALKGPGVVGPIAAGGRYYIVKVEEYLPSTLPAFEEVKDRVAQDAERAKGDGALEAYLEELRKKAQVRFAEDNPYAYQNPPVAKVNEKEILLSEVLQPVFSNQQTVALVQQGLGELAVQFFLPQTLENLIDRELLVEAARKSGKPFIGSKAEIAEAYLRYETRDVTASEEEARAFYSENPALFTVPASAKVIGVNFKEEAKAKAFRAAALRGGDLEALAKAQEGTVTDYGTVNPNQLPAVLDRLVFKITETFPKGPLGEVSEVIKMEDGSYTVLLISDRKAEELKSFAQVAEEAQQGAVNRKRSEKAQALIQALRKEAKIENRLAEVLQALTPKTSSQEQPEPEEAPANNP